ncbi:MAG: hypothetical protein V4710_00390 [Verrucomicrobiota bacterium]
MNDTLLSNPRRLAIFGGAAMLLALLQITTTAAIFWLSFLPALQQQLPRELEWGEGIGALVFFSRFIAVHLILIAAGLVLTILSFMRRERPVWLREAALVFYGPASIAVVVFVLWMLFLR